MIGLLSPIEVKGLPLKNRLVMPPMQTGLATRNGEVTDELIQYYAHRAHSVGLLIVEHSYVSLEGQLSANQLGIYKDTLRAGLEKLASRIHSKATPVVIQINHAGNKANTDITGLPPVGPSATETARQLQIEELNQRADAYASAAERAITSGFDGVEVHGAHGFLLNQFYSPLTNKRRDQYGGSLENRIRLPLKVVKKVRKTIGNRLLLYRLGAVDLDPVGTQIADSMQFAIKLKEAGVDIIDVSGGLCGSRPAQLQTSPGYFISQAQQIRAATGIPVIGVGGIRDPDYANQLIEEKTVDLVAVGRPMLNDAEWSAKFIRQVKSSKNKNSQSKKDI